MEMSNLILEVHNACLLLLQKGNCCVSAKNAEKFRDAMNVLGVNLKAGAYDPDLELQYFYI